MGIDLQDMGSFFQEKVLTMQNNGLTVGFARIREG